MSIKTIIIIKLIYIISVIFPYFLFVEPNDFFRNILICFAVLYFVINISYFLNENNKLIIFILNTLDVLMVLSSVIITVFLFISALINEGESGFVFLIYPILGTFFFFGLMGLFITKLNNKNRKI